MPKIRLLVLAAALFTLPFMTPRSEAQAVVVARGVRLLAPIANHARCFTVETIDWLANQSARAGGTKSVGLWLAAKKLPNSVLEDTYLRIAIRNGHLQRKEAETMFTRLNGKPGFRTTLRKVTGASDAKSTGHLNELRLASAAEENSLKVLNIGERFQDPAKRGITDIDLLLKHESRTIAVEAKSYLPSTPYPLDKFRADMVSLKAFQSENPAQRVVPVFSMTTKPNDLSQWELLKHAAKANNVHLIVGDAQEQVAQLMILAKIAP